MVDEALSFILLLLLFLCSIFICVHGSRVFQEYTSFLFLVKGEAVRSASYKSVDVCVVEIDGIGDVLFFDVFPKFGPILSRP